MKKTSSLLVAAILIMSFSSALMAKEKRGANVVVTKNDGSQLSGELIAVRQDSLLLLVGGPSAGVAHSIAWEMITKIVIVKHPKVVQGMALGGLILGGSGVLLGYISGDDPPERGWDWFTRGDWFSFSAGQKAAIFGFSLGLVGLVAGGLSGALDGIDKTILVDSKSKANLSRVRARLGAIARVKGIQ